MTAGDLPSAVGSGHRNVNRDCLALEQTLFGSRDRSNDLRVWHGVGQQPLDFRTDDVDVPFCHM